MADLKTLSEILESVLIACADVLKELVGELCDPSIKPKIIALMNKNYKTKG